MKKSFRNGGLAFLIFFVMFGALVFRAEAFSLNLDSLNFLQRTAGLIVSRVSDIISYLITQGKYISVGLGSSGPEQPTSSTPVSVAPALPRSSATSSVPASRTVRSGPVSNSSVPGAVAVASYNNNSDILKYTNEARAAASLNPLFANAFLDTIAGLRVDDLFTNQYFDHVSPDGKSVSDLAKAVGYGYLLIGENLALGNFTGDQEVVSAWMESEGHRANILNGKYTELGVAERKGIYKGEEATIAVQIFGLPLISCPEPNQATKALIDTSTASIKQMQGEALIMYNNLDVMKNNSTVDRSYYNQKIQEYNYFAGRVNSAIAALKGMINIYNAEVSNYNYCINP